MATIIKPPTKLRLKQFEQRPSIALFGSIEQGKASQWQTAAQELLKDFDIDIYNPRRDYWDESLEQSIRNPVFKDQVEWELTVLENADVRIYYFDPETKSPVTLMELGLAPCWGSSDTIVVCPEGFWRKGNVDIVCQHYGIHMEETLAEGIYDAISRLVYNYGVKRPKLINPSITPSIEPEIIEPEIINEPTNQSSPVC
ncbi:nucleoside 2-deoxyribosyltransferase domain-containing protein [Acinetobacter sp.]|uniref:nucleoside 2-deoxyribosyltransferase domain-containing protein n=1 Tax=Acinetobacter sp. TaxID=472 RepID=UPI0037503FEB